MAEIIIIGGGVIGLSLAYELAQRNHQVTVIERDQFGMKSSWAGAGILPPTNLQTAIHPIEVLESHSTQLHLKWSQQLRQETGIDNQLDRCGGLYIARSAGEVAALTGLELEWAERKIEFQNWTKADLSKQIKALNTEGIRSAAFLPDEYQIRNPRHIQALVAGCQRLGVTLLSEQSRIEIVSRSPHNGISIDRIQVSRNVSQTASPTDSSSCGETQSLTADFYCFAAGAWTQALLAPLGVTVPTTPVRGQVALFDIGEAPFRQVINEGSRYLVPRQDGKVLAGTTIEEVGFDCSTTENDIDELIAWANRLLPACSRKTLISSWAGLRPGSYDGFPYLGFIGNSTNVLVAAGHFKSGLHWSTGTAVVMADLIDGKTLLVDLSPFDPNRGMMHQLY